MRFRRVVLVVLLVGGFYYITTHAAPSGALAAWLERIAPASSKSVLHGPLGTFELTEANAQPAFDSEEQNNIAVYKKALPSVVNITSTSLAFNFFYGPVPQEGQGSGFIIDKQGHILTNNHVIANAQRVEVTLNDQHKYKADVIGVDKGHDLALLLINAPNLTPATFSDSSGLTVGQKVYAIGNPFGLSGTMTRGIISSIRSINGAAGNLIDNAIQTDAAINPGNSGGPLLNSHGEVIGITTMIASNGADQSSGVGFAIPINTAKAVLDDFAKYGHVRRPTLDVETLAIPINPDLAAELGLPVDYGVLIQRVLPGGAAARAGLHGGKQQAYMGNVPVYLGGDVIVAIDGKQITAPQDIGNVMNLHHAGDTVKVTIYRGQTRMDVDVTLGDAKGQEV